MIKFKTANTPSGKQLHSTSNTYPKGLVFSMSDTCHQWDVWLDGYTLKTSGYTANLDDAKNIIIGILEFGS